MDNITITTRITDAINSRIREQQRTDILGYIASAIDAIERMVAPSREELLKGE